MSALSICTIKVLPQDRWIPAAAQAIEINPANAPSLHLLKLALPDAVVPPEYLAVLTSKYWGSGGVRLTVGFLDSPPSDLKARILSHMNAWGTWSNVKFVESAVNPQVRIARVTGSGYWSYLGTDILQIAANQQTMNLDGFSMNTSVSEFYRVVRHETGHTLGFPHEHKRQEIVDRIDRDKAIQFFGGPPNNWPPEKVIEQVLTPLNDSALITTGLADINSIMCYWLPASIMKDGVAVAGGSDIDALDAQFAAIVYPLPTAPPPPPPPPPPPVDPWENSVVRQLIDEWVAQADRCLKRKHPGAHVDRWGRYCGDLGSAIASCVQPPDHPAQWDSYHYLWVNNFYVIDYALRPQEYVTRRLNGETFDALAACR